MALKILLADDSMTAQNMGKKILVDAGYEVIAVSNGAAAVKKIAETKPDLLVLDIYMPGYTGLEVCERVKNAAETAKVPVLLTVGKMEPYRPEDGAKVRADGVIIKPFEASDLIAAVGKLAELVAPKKVSASAKYEKTIVMKAEDFKDLSYEQWKAAAPAEEAQETPVTVPEEMSSAPAMMDELTVEAPVAMAMAAAVPVFEDAMPAGFDVTPPETSVFNLPAEMQVAEMMVDAPEGAAPAFSMDDMQLAPAVADVTPAMEMHEVPAFSLEEQAAPAFAIDLETAVEAPAFDLTITEMGSSFELETSGPAMELGTLGESPTDGLEFTAAPQVGEVEVAQESALELTLQDDLVISQSEQDPALATDPTEITSFATKFGEKNPEPITVGIVSDLPEMLLETESESAFIEPLEAEFAPAALEEAVIGDQSMVADEPIALDEPMVAEEPPVVLEAEAEAAPELDSMAQIEAAPAMEASVLEEAPVVEQTAWSAEETMVLPAEAAAVLEQEMNRSFAQTQSAPLVDVLETPVVDTAAETGIEEQITDAAPVLEDAPPPVLQVEETAAPEIPPQQDHEFAAAMHAALSEMQVEEVVTAPDAVLPADATSATMGEATSSDVEIDPIDALLQSQEPCLTEKSTAMSAATSFGSGQVTSVDASRIADVVQRVFERYKEQMVAEIARELSEDR